MKPVKMILMGLMFLGCTIMPIAGVFIYDAHVARDLTHEILARAPELGNFLPQEITVQAGRKIRLRVRNVDTLTHGFTIPSLGIEAREIKAGHSSIIEFTPEKAGTYDYYCTVWCSEFHLQMRGKIVVTAP